MTQGEVAARLGIQRPAAANWERGRNGPNKRILPRLAALYGCPVEDLLVERRRDGGQAERPTRRKGGAAAMTRDQYERTEEALVAAIERAETPEAVIKLTELLMNVQRQAPATAE